MAIYRTIQLSFWTDEKVLDDFTPEDKYFYLYLFTNPQTNLSGCYQLGWTQTTNQTGYTKETIMRLIDRFTNVHKVLKYSSETKEIILLNWHKYNWTTSGRFLISLRKEIEDVKNTDYREHLEFMFNEYLNEALSNTDLKEKELELLNKIEFFERGINQDTVSIPYAYRMHTSVTVTDTVTDNITDSIKEIIDYLNIKTNSKYTYRNKFYNSKISARLKDGFKVEDFKTVIDKKCDDWKDTEYEQYLTPDTLFAPTKFEKYLNQKSVKKGGTSLLDAIARA